MTRYRKRRVKRTSHAGTAKRWGTKSVAPNLATTKGKMTLTEKKSESKIECFSCMDTEDLMPGLRMCKVCYSKAYDLLEFDENGNPIFQTYEEMERFASALKQYPIKKSEPKPEPAKKSRSKKKPAVNSDEGASTVANLDRDFIMESRHFYTRKGATFASVKTDAKQTKALSNENNCVVFAHDHVFSEPCSTNCQEV